MAARLCPLCRVNPVSSREHVLPRWYVDEAFHAYTGPFTTEQDGAPATKPDGSVRPPQDTFSRATLDICNGGAGCNGTLERRFEARAKPIVRGIWQGRLSLNAAEATDFALWVLKTWLLMTHPETQISDPGWKDAVVPWDITLIPDDIYGWTVDGGLPPDGLTVWVARGEIAADTRIYLPTIVADGNTTRFQSFAHGLDFLDAGLLDVHVVYHPGWAIDHPLERDGRAVKLWPRDLSDPLDLGAIPASTEGQVSWAEGPSLSFEDGTYVGLERDPLSPELDLHFPPSPPGVLVVRSPTKA